MADSPDSPNVPAPEPNDSAEVVRCLEAARDMWELAQLKEAVRWVQRGADAAEQDGNDMRALALARLGADLSAYARSVADKPAEKAQDKAADAPTSSPSTPPARSLPSAPSPPRPRVSQPPPLPGAAPVEAEKSATAEEKSEKPSVSAEKAVAEKAAAAEKPASEKQASAEKPAVEKATAAEKSSPSGSEKAGPSNAPARSLPTTPSRPPAGERASTRPVPQAPTISKSPSPSMSPKAPAVVASASSPPTVSLNGNAPIAELLSSGKAERVTVKRSALDGSVLVVRPSQGGKVPHGARQAVLVYTDDDAG